MTEFKEERDYENKDACSIQCAHKGCGIKFAKELHRGGEASEYIDYHRIFDAILDTRLFCMKHAIAHAEILCMNARIPLPE